ncbi:DNA-directed RNA polymerase I subunit, putative [Pediculus humanus corporis]|uniref:DNA-directed RNA polymerase subunit n=1 Tax=Pediculus humanus subsp. corporis TaxID=121224 RepID=E0VBV6_PEDHC|nr:DNA-directed RNA polymerase I subunit, putative [Pediculus humanus corporis]EEB10862.1 DNA-directed RNA polymerase I subunit, putative [Pediculus humanus corporis]
MADFKNTFEGEKGFCWNCGSILPMLDDSAVVKCFMCKFEYGPEAFGAMESHYQIKFRSPYGYKETENFNQRKMQKNEGPVVERKCSKCGNDIMSYATLQLRSADEGQTVFYTCTKCGYKETENS